MPLIKKYDDDRTTCHVTFLFPEQLKARTVHVVAEFNSWERDSLPMTLDEGAWQVTVKLTPDHEYQYRYLVDGNEWFNDAEADDYVAHPYGGENSVVRT